MKINEETTVSEEQVLFNTLRYEDQELVMKIMKRLIFFELNCELEEEKKIPKKLDHLIGYDIQQFDDLKEYVEITTNDLFGKINKVIDTLDNLIDYLKSKGE